MSVEKMKLLSITGKEENIDKFIADYLIDSGMQTENAVKVFEKGWKLTNFKYDSTAKELLKNCQELLEKYKIKYNSNLEAENTKKTLEDIKNELLDYRNNFSSIEKLLNTKRKQKEANEKKLELLYHIRNLDIDMKSLYNLEYVKFRYGKLPKENLRKLENSLRNLNAIILRIEEDDKDNEWIICLTTKDFSAKVDSFLNVFKLERCWLPPEFATNPKELWHKIEREIQSLKFDIENLEDELNRIRDRDAEDLVNLYSEINLYIKINNVKKFMAYDSNGLFYIIGWIPAKELTKILPKLAKEKGVKYVVKNHDEVAGTPPTKLKNNRVFKPFETIVEMYGLPNYTETDPTAFVAITAFLLFGFMFGDVGHGLVIFLLGLLLSRKKVPLGPVFQAGGIASMIFGVLYGSVFGKEGIIKAIFISPMENIQTMLIYGIAIGVILIILAMLLNIKNGIKNKDKKKIFFETNGIAGLTFYVMVLGAGIYFFVKGKMIVSISILSIFVIIPLILIMFKDTFAKLLFKEEEKEKSSLVEKTFEVVEILLSFASNTISFVRIAAFAINHVGLCMAVYILSNMMTGSGQFIVSLIGNIIIIVLEGLIVAIQVLRLEYYELFSRFYSGDGKEYKPLKEKI